MAEVTEDDLQKEILKILEKANLAKTSTKKVRQKLEEVFDTDLTDKKELIDQYVMDYVNKMDSEDSDEEEEAEEKKKPAPKKRKKRKASDEWVEKKPKKAAGRGKGSGYTRAYKLSPALAELMGQDEMPRHEVVKRVWTIIKEKNLYDPNNKQFAICNEALYKVIGTKRFRTFGMMKYLKTHFLD